MTISRLEHALTEFDFIIQYSKGEDMPSNYLSRKGSSAIDAFVEDILVLQHADELDQSVFFIFAEGFPTI